MQLVICKNYTQNGVYLKRNTGEIKRCDLRLSRT